MKTSFSPRRMFAALISAHPSLTSPIERRKAELIAALSLGLSVISAFGGIGTALRTGFDIRAMVTLLMAAIALVSYGLSRSPRYTYGQILLIATLALSVFIVTPLSIYQSLVALLSVAITLLITNLLDLRQMAVFTAIILVGFIVLRPILLPGIAGQEAFLMQVGMVGIGIFLLFFAWHRQSLEQLRLNEILQAQNALEERNRALQIAQQELNKRFAEIQLAGEVGRAVSQVRALDELLKDAVERIRARFDLYYVQVYLVNPAQTHLVLEAGTGEVGTTLRARKHQLALNTGSINGRAAVEKKPVVIANTTQSAVFKPNPLLPKTRAEMAIPLIVAERVVGVLDMQSEQPGGLTEEMLPAFEALAGQLAVAIQNARLLTEAEQARAEVEAYARRLERTGWQEYLDSIHRPEQIGYLCEQDQILPLEAETALPQENTVMTPIQVGGEALGTLAVELQAEEQTPQARELVRAVARQVAEHLENLRLLEMAERYRQEAEQAARRLTLSGWQEYLRSRTDQPLGYFYDLTQVKPIEQVNTLTANSALTIPVQVRDETIGKLSVLDVDPNDQELYDLVHSVATRLSEHIETLRLLEETQRGQLELDRRARQLAAVSEITTISSRETDVNRMLEIVVHLTQRKFGLYHAHIFTYNPANRQLLIVSCGWKEGDEHEGTHGTTTIAIDQEQSLVARAARTRQPVLVNDVRSDPGWLPNPLLPETRAELAVPLLIGDEVLGVLDVQSERINAFSEEDVNIQVTLAAQVATALQNARNYERARRQAEREALLNAISQKIQSATSVEAVLQIAARELGHALRAPRAIAQLSLKDS
ncbi:MAG: hypothetical protein DDG60_15235 [Anaerolineae bacterium]|nr:MAG: hypothetical protein DDG60_15235 [Anaerolineae bacterium]